MEGGYRGAKFESDYLARSRHFGVSLHGGGSPFGPNGHEWGQGSRSGWLHGGFLTILLGVHEKGGFRDVQGVP